ncbi:hypothetical protein [Hydrogenophaga sp.]|uniref:hypothetical protein n=1 Tax=Hydrogenophaga sp. TaxID=1904254 RepID=UPI001AC7B3BB|nr:hypothetical protein [Hydrogenophaga sp.]MBN9373626.1 hypothetical protein [Hydrogenophaga sp.]
MKNIPSALRWLAEKGARMAGDLEHGERVLQLLQGQRTWLLADLSVVDRSGRFCGERIDRIASKALIRSQGDFAHWTKRRDRQATYPLKCRYQHIPQNDLRLLKLSQVWP